MSSKVNEALFDLIQSMSKSEKRYFKLASSRHTIGEENNYVLLFDFIDKMDQYNEPRIFEAFDGEAFLNRFSITKKRLYDHILSALDAYHTISSVEAQLFKALHSADILFEKSLYEQSRRVLRSAEKLATKHELNGILLLINDKQKRLFETKGYQEISDEELEVILKKEKTAIEAIEACAFIWTVKSRLFKMLSKKGVARSKEEIQSYTNICQELLVDYQLNKMTVEGKYLYHHTLSAYFYAIGELSQSLNHLRLNLSLMQELSVDKVIEPNRQISVLTNAIYIADKLGQTKESITYLAALKKFASSLQSNEDLSIKLFSSISSIELSIYLRKGSFESAVRFSNDIAENLAHYGDKVVPLRRAFLAFKIAVAHMGHGDYQIALKWINSILNDPDIDSTEDILAFTQLLDLLVHIELNHQQLLPYSLKSVQRFFKTRNRLYSFEKIFLHFIGKLIKCEDRFSMDELWEELYNELAKLTTDDVFESIAMDYFDFQSWAESKLKRKSFEEIVREKYNVAMIRTAS